MKDFSPFGLILSTVGLTVYHGQAWDLPTSVLQEVLDAVKAGDMSVPIAGVFNGLEQVPDAHRAMESHAVPGKNVVVLGWGSRVALDLRALQEEGDLGVP